MMVGSLPAGFDAERDQEWVLSDLITLLGLATGRGVLVPFVELRGAAGELVARFPAPNRAFRGRSLDLKAP